MGTNGVDPYLSAWTIGKHYPELDRRTVTELIQRCEFPMPDGSRNGTHVWRKSTIDDWLTWK